MSLTRYEAYKDSGVEWIGEIPEGWEVKRLKWLAKILNGQDHKSVWDTDGIYPILGSGGVFGYANQCLHRGPSVLLGRKGTIDKPQYIDNAFWAVDTAYFTEIHSENNPKFFYYLCTTIDFDLHKYGSAVPSMTQEVLNQIPFALPTLPEQTAIAIFLDRKTAEIDQLIANKEKLIALYEEEKTAIINRAVTRGLDPQVKLKPSGVDWLGDIPEHWEVKKIKYLFNNLDFRRIPLSSDERGRMLVKEYDYYGASGIIDHVENYIFDGEYILIGEDGANLITRSTALAFKATGKFWVNNHAHILEPKDGPIDFWVNYLENLDYRIWVTGSAQPKLTAEALANIDIAIPPVSEQTAIVTQIETECARLDAIIAKFKKQIELFKEYRTTLISEVVTGKIDVRGEAEA